MSLLDNLLILRENVLAYREGKPYSSYDFEPDWGICSNLACSKIGLTKLFREWPHFSGDKDFPVPSTDDERDARSMYEWTLNKWEGDYGDLRFDLLNFLIERLQQ